MEAKWLKLRLRLKAYLGRLLKRPEDVEDVIQESFVRILEAAAKGSIEYPTAYLYRTAHNVALNSLARKSNQLEDFIEDLADSDVLDGVGELDDQVMAQQRFQLFCQAAAELPEQCRKVLILCRVYGLSYQEVAERLSISVSTVEKHVAKGLIRCATFMEHREGTGRANASSRRLPTQRKA